METKLRCTLYPGQFSNELAAVVQSHWGTRYSLFVPDFFVTSLESPTYDRPVDGWMTVELLKQEGDLYLIRLPQSTLENGQYLFVKADQLQRASELQPA